MYLYEVWTAQEDFDFILHLSLFDFVCNKKIFWVAIYLFLLLSVHKNTLNILLLCN